MQVKPLGPTALAAVDGRRHALIGRGQEGDAWLRHVGMQLRDSVGQQGHYGPEREICSLWRPVKWLSWN